MQLNASGFCGNKTGLNNYRRRKMSPGAIRLWTTEANTTTHWGWEHSKATQRPLVLFCRRFEHSESIIQAESLCCFVAVLNGSERNFIHCVQMLPYARLSGIHCNERIIFTSTTSCRIVTARFRKNENFCFLLFQARVNSNNDAKAYISTNSFG